MLNDEKKRGNKSGSLSGEVSVKLTRFQRIGIRCSLHFSALSCEIITLGQCDLSSFKETILSQIKHTFLLFK